MKISSFISLIIFITFSFSVNAQLKYTTYQEHLELLAQNQIGKQITDWTLVDLDGVGHSSKDLKTKYTMD